MSSLSSVPPMPVEQAPETAFAIYTALMVLVTGGMLAWWAVRRDRRASAALPLLILGGALSGLMEPWLDNVVLYRWPPEQDLAAFEAFGRTIPIFVIVGYGWFCGGLLFFVARALEAAPTARRVWAMLGIVAVVDFVAIGLSAWIGVSDFFGDPPMEIARYPLWWAAIDGLDVVLGGAIVLLLVRHLRGARQLWLVLVPPIALGGAAGVVSWPVSIAINSQWSMPAKWACALATIGLGLAAVHAIAQTLPRLARLSADEADPGVEVLERPRGLEGLGAADALQGLDAVEHHVEQQRA
jgi:hypothetical protein